MSGWGRFRQLKWWRRPHIVAVFAARKWKDNEDKMMTIVRIDAEARWSDVVIHNNTLYYTGVPENLDADAFDQTANTLAQIDAVLEKQGSNKSSILDATIFLADKTTSRRWIKRGMPGCRGSCAGALHGTSGFDEPEV